MFNYYDVDWDTLRKDDNDMPEWITIWIKGQPVIPTWCRFGHDEQGSYIVVDMQKNYLFVNEG